MVDPLNEIVIPLVGLITATILFYSPLREMREVDKTRLVGKLNVFPMACIPGNCFAWMVYALPTSNLWLWWSNLPSFMIGLWYMSVTLRATDLTAATYRMVQVVVGGGMLLVSLGLMMVIIAEDELSVAKNVVGAICILLLLVFYFAPLSTLVAVLRARDSSAFLLPLAVTTALNGAAWSAFGFYLGDAFLYGPNLIGAVNGCLQIGCCLGE
ncbi:hypothetical protein JKP88DRAFT_164694 [Tribonema minus]|uniref:Bidirectional sugar transporter SWEET n=1 Tax=Tribonema minus TaxID=303371 RepID=A0A835Z586_9STRA|nr:hypothetical protein JKP88DRAFT_164694 [Tribonema minus]